MKNKDGFIIVNKEEGCTSHDCVIKIRKLFNIKKVGHTGTLDPQVTGTLPIAIGSATRFIQYLPQEKTYIGKIKLGIKTTTDDINGEIICEKNWPIISKNQLDKYLKNFRGVFQQIPPKVSSVHIEGKRAYQKFLSNEDFKLSPRKVRVDKLLLISWNQSTGILEIEVKCSAGTYIRSIARDLGGILGSEACLFSLKRIKASGFCEKDSIKISDINNLNKNQGNLIIPTILALNHISTIILKTEEEINFWRSGRRIFIKAEDIICDYKFEYQAPIKIIDIKENLLGIGFANKEKDTLSPKLVLNAK